jgi:transcriptional regulator with PAS, ATPase and Fis domain
MSQCETLLDIIEDVTEKNTLEEKQNKNTKSKYFDLTFLDADSEYPCPFEEELIKNVFVTTNGNKTDICRILGISGSLLNKKIAVYKLKKFLNSIRREYRSNGTKYKE